MRQGIGVRTVLVIMVVMLVSVATMTVIMAGNGCQEQADRDQNTNGQRGQPMRGFDLFQRRHERPGRNKQEQTG